MRERLHRALAATAGMGPSLTLIFAWIGQAAAILDNPVQQGCAFIQAHYQALMAQLAAQLTTPAGEPRRARADHVLKITRSYWPGLFHCYEVTGLPRTNNDLEPLFGTVRHHERRSTGRKIATPTLITRGSVRVLAAVLTRIHPVEPVQLGGWTRWRGRRPAGNSKSSARRGCSKAGSAVIPRRTWPRWRNGSSS